MSGFVVLQDGRAYAAANWAYDVVIERVADALPPTDAGLVLSMWLMEQRISVRGLGTVDLRELTPENQRLVIEAVQNAFRLAERHGADGWDGDPEAYAGWLDRFRDLISMIDSIRRGEPPSAFNPHMTDVVPPTEERAGPGWDKR